MIESKSPYSNKLTATFDHMSDSELEIALNKVFEFQKGFARSSMERRERALRGVAVNLRAHKYQLAELITSEMGKLISESLAEVEKCAWVCDYYADKASLFLTDEEIKTEASKSVISYRPLGVILGVMPWNFPFWQVFRFAAPAVMAGNAVILKHSSLVPRCAMEIEKLFMESSYNGPILKNVFATKEQVAGLIEDKRVAGVTLTGSEMAGRKVAAAAGESLKKTVLELGGSDPYVILEDADIDLAVEVCLKARMMNAGQSCIGAKRFIVHKALYNEFLSKFRKGMEAYSFGDPLNNKSTLAPLASYAQRESLHKQVLAGIKDGAHLLTGGYIPNELEGAFYPPTILTEIEPENSVHYQELFGPVAMIYRAEDEEQALAIANDTPFGLGAALFSENEDRAWQIANDLLHAGSCFINAQVKSDPRLPFGGIKQSGYGRELSYFGIREFTNTKTVYRR